MGFSIGGNSQKQGVPDDISITPVPSSGTADTTDAIQSPHVKQPVQDNLLRAEGGDQKVLQYSSSAQIPLLQQPAEANKEGEKTKEKVSTASTDTTQMPEVHLEGGPTTKIDTLEKGATVNPLDALTYVTQSGMFSPPVNPAQFLSNGEKLMQEIYSANMKFAESMPDGPDKYSFVNFLKVVQEALIGFQELLRNLQTQDATGARKRTQARLETTLAKIETQRKQQDEIHRKQEEAAHKMKVLGPLMGFFAFLMVAVLSAIVILLGSMMLASGPAGWMALSMMVCELIDQGAKMVGQKPFMMQKLLEGITIVTDAIVESCRNTFNLSPEQVKEGKMIAKTVVVSLSMAAATAAAPTAFVFGGVTALISFLNESHIVRHMQIRAGASEQDASMAEMYASIAISAAFAIAALALAFVMPVGALGGIALTISETLARFALKAAEIITNILRAIKLVADAAAQTVVNVIKAIIQTALDPEIWATMTSLGLQTTSAVMTYQYEHLLADIAVIRGKMDSDVELSETTILILKKMIQQLLAALQGSGDQILQIGQLLKKAHANVSQITTNLFG